MLRVLRRHFDEDPVEELDAFIVEETERDQSIVLHARDPTRTLRRKLRKVEHTARIAPRRSRRRWVPSTGHRVVLPSVLHAERMLARRGRSLTVGMVLNTTSDLEALAELIDLFPPEGQHGLGSGAQHPSALRNALDPGGRISSDDGGKGGGDSGGSGSGSGGPQQGPSPEDQDPLSPKNLGGGSPTPPAGTGGSGGGGQGRPAPTGSAMAPSGIGTPTGETKPETEKGAGIWTAVGLVVGAIAGGAGGFRLGGEGGLALGGIAGGAIGGSIGYRVDTGRWPWQYPADDSTGSGPGGPRSRQFMPADDGTGPIGPWARTAGANGGLTLDAGRDFMPAPDDPGGGTGPWALVGMPSPDDAAPGTPTSRTARAFWSMVSATGAILSESTSEARR
jgi:hypothetical protein